jgi:DNA topoisomerase-2
MLAKDLAKAEQQGLLEFFKLTTKINTSNMICFDAEQKIKKYDTAEEILEDFYPIRLIYYQKRKVSVLLHLWAYLITNYEQDFLANELQISWERLTNQARFVQMIIDKQLIVSNRRKADIVADLKKHEFRAFPKRQSGQEVGENVDSDDDESNTLADYDYLLGMAIWSLTKEKIAKLKEQAGDKENDLKRLLEKSPKDLWNADLDLFLEGWEVRSKRDLFVYGLTWLQRNCIEFEENQTKDAKGKKVKRKQTVLRTRKSIGQGRSDGSDDEFKPIKAPAAGRKKAGTLAAETRKASSSKGKEKAREDDEVKPVPEKSAAPKRKTTAQKVYVLDDEDDEEYGEVSAPAKKKAEPRPATTSKEAPAKRKASGQKKILDEESSEDELEAIAPAKSKAQPKRQVLKSESESDIVIVEKGGKGKRKR